MTSRDREMVSWCSVDDPCRHYGLRSGWAIVQLKSPERSISVHKFGCIKVKSDEQLRQRETDGKRLRKDRSVRPRMNL